MPEQPLWQRQREAMQAATEDPSKSDPVPTHDLAQPVNSIAMMPPLVSTRLRDCAILWQEDVYSSGLVGQRAYPRETGILTIDGIAYRLAAPGEAPDLYITWPWADWDYRAFVRVYP